MQIQYAPLAIAGAFVTIIVASLVPVLRNANLNIDGAGPFTQVSTARFLLYSKKGQSRCCKWWSSFYLEPAESAVHLCVQKAEVINGRVAMVAFALTIAVETFKAGPGLVP